MKLAAAVLAVVGLFAGVFLGINTVLSGFEIGTPVAIIEAFALSVGLGLFIGARLQDKHAKLLETAVASGVPTDPSVITRSPRDGAKVVFAGRLSTYGDPLKSPFTGRAAAFYSYVVAQRPRHQDDKVLPTYVGWGRTSCYVRAANGTFKLLRYPAFQEGFQLTKLNAAVISSKFKEFQSSTQFATAGVMSSLGWEGQFDESDETIRRDMQFASLPADLNECVVEEIVVPTETLVFVSGKYSAAKKGLTGAIRIIEISPRSAKEARMVVGQLKLSAAAIMILFGGFGLIMLLVDVYRRLA